VVTAPETDVGVGANCDTSGTTGYKSTLTYQMRSFTGLVIANEYVNEFFPGDPVNDISNNWTWPEPSAILSASGTFTDVICVSVTTFQPQPMQPASPLGTAAVSHRAQLWYVGTPTASQNGVQVQSDTLQRYQDHGTHTNVNSPVR
jgi:hypothetical protein